MWMGQFMRDSFFMVNRRVKESLRDKMGLDIKVSGSRVKDMGKV